MNAPSILYVIAFATLFLISPLMSIISQSVLLIVSRRDSFYRVAVFMLTLAGVLAVINTTKIPVSDMAIYLEHYQNAGSSDFISYVASSDFEPAYAAYVFFLHKIFLGSAPLFIFGFTFLSYVILFSALLCLTKKIELNSRSTVQLLLAVALFPQIFVLSFHLNRQFFAGVLVLLFFALYLANGKKNYISYTLSAIFHSSTFVFVPFVIFDFNEKSIPRTIFVFLAFLTTVFLLLPILGEFLVGLDFYYAQRIGGRLLTTQHAATGGFGMLGRMFLIICFFGSYVLFRHQSRLDGSVSRKGLLAYILAFLFVSVVVFVSSFFDDYSEIAGRFNLYSYLLSLPILALLVGMFSYARMMLMPLMVFLLAYFFSSIESNVFVYEGYLSRLWFLWV